MGKFKNPNGLRKLNGRTHKVTEIKNKKVESSDHSKNGAYSEKPNE
jgi:hypothetical protein